MAVLSDKLSPPVNWAHDTGPHLESLITALPEPPNIAGKDEKRKMERRKGEREKGEEKEIKKGGR